MGGRQCLTIAVLSNAGPTGGRLVGTRTPETHPLVPGTPSLLGSCSL